MKKKIVAAVLLSALVFSAGCGKQSESDSESMSDQPAVSEESAEPEQAEIVQNQNVSQISEIKKPIVTFEKVENNVMSEDGQVTLVYASFMQPTFYLNDNDVVQKLETAFQEIELGYERVLSESAEEVGWQYEENGDEIVSYEVAYDFSLQRGDDRVLSFIQESYGYMAGVHGYTEETGLNFDMKTGEALSLNDIAADKEALLDSSKSYIAELLELPRFEEALYGSKEDAMKVVEEDVLSDDNYWYFTNTGITFVANAYILGPYAAGSFHFDIPYEKLNGLKEEYKYQGPYEMGLPIGAAGTADLDGDGQQDMISYQCTIDEATSEPIPVLVINDTDFSDALKDENAFLTEGANEYSADKYYIVDLDVSDKYLELAIRDSGPSDDPVTFFLRYDGQKLAYLGCIGDFVGKSTTILNGDGTIQADVHSGEPGTKAETVLYQWDEENGIQALK